MMSVEGSARSRSRSLAARDAVAKSRIAMKFVRLSPHSSMRVLEKNTTRAAFIASRSGTSFVVEDFLRG